MKTKIKLVVMLIFMVPIVLGQFEVEYTKNPDFTSPSKLWVVTYFTDLTDTKGKLFS